jgi:hypothetical protein
MWDVSHNVKSETYLRKQIATAVPTARDRRQAPYLSRITQRRKTLLVTIIAMLRVIARTHAKGQLRFDLEVVMDITVEWNADKSRAQFTCPQQAEWTVQTVTDLMQVLGQIRAEMSPAVPDDPPLLETVSALHDPRWWSNLEDMSGGSLLLIRHPALGWLPFLLPIESRTKMIEIFQEQERLYGEKMRAH